MTQKIKRIGILTAGGDCPGLNAVIRAVTKSAQNIHDMDVVGIPDGFIGLAQKKGHVLSNREVSGILATGGTILGTARGNPFEAAGYEDEDYQCFYDAFEKLEIGALVCTGGEGTMTMANKLHNHGLPVVGVPKTIDNDVLETDLTFGFDSAVSIVMEAIDNLHSTAMSHHRVIVVEVMGRHVGWLALSGGVAGGGDILLIPELDYDEDVIFKRVKDRSSHGKRFSIVVVAEGVKASGKLVGEKSEDGRIRLGGIAPVLSDVIEEITELETRPVILGHLQRGGPPTAFDRLLATQLAVRAVDLAAKKMFGYMSAVKGSEIAAVPIPEVVKGLKKVPPDHPLIYAAEAVGTSFGMK